MRVTCVLTNPFPNGLGATPFMKQFCRGLINHDAKVTLISHYPLEIPYERHCSYEGIDVKYTYHSKSSNNSGKIHKKIVSIIPSLRLFILLWQEVFIKKTDCIEFHSYGYSQCLAKIFFGFFCRIIIFHGEYPNAGRPVKKLFPKILQWTELNWADRQATLLMCSSSNLADFYGKYLSRKCRVVQVPLLIDSKCFSDFPADADKNYITYCGDFGGNKDGVPDLLKAFSLIAEDFPEIKLKLIGGSSDPDDLKKLQNFVVENNLSGRVVFTGPIPHSDMPKHLGNSRILALARPNNRQAHGGFPGKLGEYLATGVPVVVTRVGVIDQYFEDEKHLFFAEPDNPEMFAYRLRYVLSNPDLANKVAAAGQKTACSLFDYNIQVAKILQVFQETSNV